MGLAFRYPSRLAAITASMRRLGDSTPPTPKELARYQRKDYTEAAQQIVIDRRYGRKHHRIAAGYKPRRG